MSNVALKAGSSKQGKARRAFVGSNWVVASHLEEKRTIILYHFKTFIAI